MRRNSPSPLSGSPEGKGKDEEVFPFSPGGAPEGIAKAGMRGKIASSPFSQESFRLADPLASEKIQACYESRN